MNVQGASASMLFDESEEENYSDRDSESMDELPQ